MSASFAAVLRMKGLQPPLRSRSAFRSCLHARGRLAVPPGRHVVGAAPTARCAIPHRSCPQLRRAAASARGRHPSRHGETSLLVLRLLSHGASWRTKEIAGERARRLLAQERAPRLAGALGCGWDISGGQHLAGGRRRNREPELLELAGDALITTPMRVLAGKTNDQLAPRPGKRPCRLSVRIRPAPRHQLTVPAQQRLRLHRKRLARPDVEAVGSTRPATRGRPAPAVSARTVAAGSQAHDAGQGSPAPSSDPSGRSARSAPATCARRVRQTTRPHTTSESTTNARLNHCERANRVGLTAHTANLPPHPTSGSRARARTLITGTTTSAEGCRRKQTTSVRLRNGRDQHAGSICAPYAVGERASETRIGNWRGVLSGSGSLSDARSLGR